MDRIYVEGLEDMGEIPQQAAAFRDLHAFQQMMARFANETFGPMQPVKAALPGPQEVSQDRRRLLLRIDEFALREREVRARDRPACHGSHEAAHRPAVIIMHSCSTSHSNVTDPVSLCGAGEG